MARHESLFEYNLTRSYPFRWFTPVTVVGGIIATVLVSFLNVAASGYELAAITSTDPNKTLSDSTWFANWPTWLASTRASCAAATMPLQTGLYTNKTALLYTLVSVWRYDQLGNQMKLGSLVYYNNPLSNCNVSSIQVDISSDLTAGQAALTQVGATMTATVVCLVNRPEGPTYVELVTTYDPIQPEQSAQTCLFLGANATNLASLYWGDSIMRLYWTEVVMKYFDENVHSNKPYYNFAVTLNRDHLPEPATADDLEDMDFIRASACWLMPLNSTGIQHNTDFCDDNTLSVLAQGTTHQKPVPSVWQPMSVLGKGMWFTVLADMGRDDDAMPNMLSHPDLLESLTANMSVVNETITSAWAWSLRRKVTSLAPFVASQSTTNNTELQIYPSVLETNYICQVPKLKTTGTLIVSILVADLVLLQAIWKIYVLSVDRFFISKREDLKYCEGCASKPREQPGIPLGDVNPQRATLSGLDEYLIVESERVTPSLSSRQSLIDHSHGHGVMR
ncbi:hypothetical protein VMCG_03807 [Cytospora schulzeri]|uniref:Uncharacterized protein n=1 Tax=Cytospora schulzeri TaxID=448051 RepID=A0A423WVB0_9PEZI|nr:hypothetical protein VMCG_03807 [Valsa malicola]